MDFLMAMHTVCKSSSSSSSRTHVCSCSFIHISLLDEMWMNVCNFLNLKYWEKLCIFTCSFFWISTSLEYSIAANVYLIFFANFTKNIHFLHLTNWTYTFHLRNIFLMEQDRESDIQTWPICVYLWPKLSSVCVFLHQRSPLKCVLCPVVSDSWNFDSCSFSQIPKFIPIEQQWWQCPPIISSEIVSGHLKMPQHIHMGFER